ncbi:MAG: GGDEF domain-containing protein [Humidesulfovibrio sp.]|nr:GGDEF domain-containing protein [Humidesulfovibrio sp.]
MLQDEDRASGPALSAKGAGLLYAALAAALAGALLVAFGLVYGLLREHPNLAPGFIQEAYAALAIGLLLLAAQAALVFAGLVRPLREAAMRVDNLAQALDQHSHRDALTGVLNRTAFDHLIVRELEALRRYDVGFCAVMVDVDGFRQVNEIHGYETGDRVLCELAQLLKAHIRKADFLFRWRSGRFLILTSGINGTQALRFAGKLNVLVSGHAFQQGLRLTASLGVVRAQAEDSPEVLVARVKTALAQAKEQGPGNVGGDAADT